MGRPRDELIDVEVVEAVLAVLRSGGYRAVTIEKIAQRVKRARTSIYRRWPSKRHLVAFAIIKTLGAQPSPDTGSLREDLVAAVETLRRAFAGVLGQALAGLVADMAHDLKLAQQVREDVLAPRRQSMRAAFARAVARGEMAAGIDTEIALDMLTGPYYFRVLFGHAPITAAMNRKIVDYVLRASAAPGSTPSGRRSRLQGECV